VKKRRDEERVLLDEQSRWVRPGTDVVRCLRLNPAFADRLDRHVTVGAGIRDQMPVCTPLTGETIWELRRGEVQDVVEAVRRARRAQIPWAATAPRGRSAPVLRFHDLLLRRREELLDLIQLETGKARRHALEDVFEVAIVARYYAHHARRHLAPERRKGPLPWLTRAWEHYRPRGVVGIISPWSCPGLAVAEAIPALVAGNAVVFKPARQATLSVLWAVDRLLEAGLPPHLCNVVVGSGTELGSALLSRVDYVTFSGSPAVGRAVARRASEMLVGLSLELAGRNTMIVLADADLEQAVEGAIRGGFSSGGQTALATGQVLVEAGVHDQFLERLVARTKALRISAELDYAADIGSLGSEAQLARVHEHVIDAACKGATVVAGGRRRPDIGPCFYEPTILRGVGPGMAVRAGETFGPVVSVAPVANVDEAVAAANDAAPGLNVSIWTRDVKRGCEIAGRVHAGMANVNDAYAAAWGTVDAPAGGFEAAGLGRRHGPSGVRKYTESQTVAVRRRVRVSTPFGVSDQEVGNMVFRILAILRRMPWRR